MNNITISIQAPELVEAMNRLSEALSKGQIEPSQVERIKENLEAEATKPEKPKKQPKVEEPVIEAPAQPTLEDVRTLLGTLSQKGKQAEVKQLIASFGATRLTQIDETRYLDLMAQAEAL